MPIIDQLINQDLLTKHWNKIYAQKSEEKRWTSRGIDDISLKDFVKKEDENLNILFVSLEKRLFSFSPAKIVRIEKPDGDDRFLAVPTVRDRIVHSAILEILTSIFYPHINTGVSYCGVKQQFNKKEDRALNIQKAVIKFIGHVKNGNFWIFKSDINKFFDFVPKQKMLDKIFSILPDTSLNDFIKQIIYFEIGNLEELKRKKYPIPNPKLGLAQGSSLSPLFSNLYLANFDKKMPLLFNDRFIRYADDFIVVCKTQKEAKEAQLEAEKNLKNEGLLLSPKPSKTKTINLLQNKNIDFLGLNVSRFTIKPRQTKAEINKWLNEDVLNFKKNKYKSKKIKNRKTGKIKKVSVIEQVNEKIQGWSNFYRSYHVDDLYNQINRSLTQISEKNINLKLLQLLEPIKHKGIPDEQEWQQYFKIN